MNREKIILVVEDNPDDELLTLRALERNHIANEVVVAHDGEEALDYLCGTGAHQGRDVSKLPQLMLLDLNLPRMTGLDVLRRVRAEPHLHALPVVVLTSSKEEEDIVASYSLGANAYIRKPVSFEQFMEAVKVLGIFWLVLNQVSPRVSK